MISKLTIKEKKSVFLDNYRKTRNKSIAANGVMSQSTLYKYIANDEQFANDIFDIQMWAINNAEKAQEDLLKSEDERVRQTAIDRLLNSKMGKNYSHLAKPDVKPEVSINTDKVEYIIND